MPEIKTSNKTTAKIEGNEIIVNRVFNAPRELVWEAWTNPDHIGNWWGPKGFVVTTSEIDIKPGGIWRFNMTGPDGVDYPNKITFHEVVKPERLVYTSSDDQEDDPGQFQTTVTFSEQDSGTYLTMLMTFSSVEILEFVVKEYGAMEGASQTLDRLEEQLITMEVNRMENKITSKLAVTTEGKVLVMERIFNAPRELVFKAFSEPQHLENWWGPKGWQTENRTFEFKPNGVWHYCMRCVDKNQGDFYGYEAWGKVIYHEIIAPEKIILTDVFSDKDGNTVEGMPQTVVTMSFVEHDGKTKLVMRSEYATVEGMQQVIDMGVAQGTASQFERLDDLLVELQ